MKTRIPVFFILLGLIVSGISVAQVQQHNDPLAIISNRPRPNVLVLVDTSGSMLWDINLYSGSAISVRKENNNGASSTLRATNYSTTSNTMNCFLVDSDNSRSRMGQAKTALREMLSQIQDINVGLGRFTRQLDLNRFRADVPATLDQTANQEAGYTYEYWDSQNPAAGQINIPYRRKDDSDGVYYYPFCKTIKTSSGTYRSWDPTDTVWLTTTENYTYINGQHYSRMNWYYSYVENARRQMFRALTDDGDYIYRDTYASPDSTHRNKLNQVDNIDIFLSDEEMIQLKANTDRDNELTVTKYVESYYGVTIGQDLRFTYFPTISDWNASVNCSGGEILVDVQDRFDDDVDTTDDESDNRDDLIAMTKTLEKNAKVYDFSVDPAELTTINTFYGVGSTPLGTTLEAARSYYSNTINVRDAGYNVDHCRENFVILLTDGLETCGGNPESIAQDLYDTYNVKVYVIAFISSTSQADAIANAGGTDEAFTADNKDELIEALKDIFDEIRTSVELSAPVAVTSTEDAGEVIEGNIALLPFFDFPGFAGRLQARKLFKYSVVEVDPKTGGIVTDANGDPNIISDDLTDAQVKALYEDTDDPIDLDPARELVGLQYSSPKFWWDAGDLVSLPFIEEPDPNYQYDHLKQDTSDIDGDGNTAEIIVNPAYKDADSRRIMTVLDYSSGSSMTIVNFNQTDLIDNTTNKDTAKTLLDVSSWSDQEATFLINYARGKEIQRFSEETTLYGTTFAVGDPMPDPTSADDDGDGVPDDFLYVTRNWKLGDIISSTPVLIRPPTGTYPITINDNDNSLPDYDEFVAAHEDTPSVVVVGGNDGMLHAFSLNGIDLNSDNDYDDTGEYYPGEEIWAFVLPDTMSKIKNQFSDAADDDDVQPDGQRLNPHQYFVDGQITLSIVRARIHTGDTDGDGESDDPEFRVMMFFGEGRGGNRYWAFDMTDPLNPVPIWSIHDATMGMTISRPAVGAISEAVTSDLDNDNFRYYAFMGSGYDYTQTDGSATVGNVVYKVSVKDGTIAERFSCGDVAGGAGLPNAVVGRAILVDEDGDFFVERCYFGDLDGNIWRWDFDDNTKQNLLNIGSTPLTEESWRLNRPITDSLTYANIFDFHIITAATGGDTRVYLDSTEARKSYPDQTIYLLVDTDKEGNVKSLLNGIFDDDGNYVEEGETVGIDLPSYMVAENQPVISAFTEYDAEGKIYRGFQTFYPTYTPDPAGLRTIRCSFGRSDLLILDSIFSESEIVSSTTGTLISMGEGKATGITYTGGNILFSIGDEFKVYGSGIYRFESNQRVKAKLKVLSWKEVF